MSAVTLETAVATDGLAQRGGRLTREALALRQRLWRYMDRCPLEREQRAADLWRRAWARYERRLGRGI